MSKELDKLMHALGGVAGVPEMAQFLRAPEREVRAWADDEELPKVGVAFVFTRETAEQLEADFDEDADGPEDECEESDDTNDDEPESQEDQDDEDE